jgi:AraC-like DNA-binding protein
MTMVVTEMGAAHRPQTAARRGCAVERVIAYMRANLDKPQSLHGLAEVAIMSPFHFNRVFRGVTGIPPAQYLAAVRLEAAKGLLLTTPLSVTEICFEVGYNSLGTFVRRFTEVVGCSPRELRRTAAQLNVAELRRLYGGEPDIARPTSSPRISGSLAAAQDFSGLIIVGLFDAPLPHSRPLCCAVMTEPGHFSLDLPSDGNYWLMAAGLPWDDTGSSFLLQQAALRARSGRIDVRRGRASGPIVLALRSANLADPPILAALPVLLASRLKVCSVLSR